MQNYEGESRPAQMPVTINDRDGLKGQYIRHVDSDEKFLIVEVGREGVEARQVEGFGASVLPGSPEYMITWNSLKYKHKLMVHIADVALKPGQQL